MHDSESVWVATPSLYETFIHNTLPAFTGALNLELGLETYLTTGQWRPFLLMICRDTLYSSRKISGFSTAWVAPE